MAFAKTLIPSSILRALQALFGIIVLGLSVTLIRGHNPLHWTISKLPTLLPFAAAIGGLTIAGALVGFVLSWTEFLRGFFEILLDIAVLLANLVGGVLIAIRLKGKNCYDESDRNRVGNRGYPFKGSLGSIDILNGGCTEKNGVGICYYASWADQEAKLNTRCRQSQANSVFMFLTVVVLFAGLTLTYLRIKRTH
ncbi:hypothetical protein J4E91_000286 [Alternaria rosae]|nr:hypothetical protein J4E91_000286 [Alternaria rosae]